MVDQLPLPPGWEIRFNDENKKYFIDHNTKTTTYKGKYYTKCTVFLILLRITDPRTKAMESETEAGVPAAYERSFKWKVGHFRHLCAVRS